MATIDSGKDLERRKALKIRLRRDLVVKAQKYEGKTFYVVKDPVSLRYYRLKENEEFLLKFFNGKSTLEEAQESYEEKFRPDRLKLEDLEAFAQQLVRAGLAQNESPRAGKQLFDNRKKRLRSEWLQTLTNILYIKLPVIDPDRILKTMSGWVGWIFSTWFFILSLGLMFSAILLVATHFETFRSKLPDYHSFFQFKTIVYLWAALAVVKVIHEFGHGLSCKRFGGEVHEMGLLFLCFSPAMYCNVSDAWTLPNKWHRIIISFAGIYVELVIAAIATFVWWYSPAQPFINNLALSLMIVCSVSTVVFNANPLMRYDGYYVLADWLEIPNLREKSTRFLSNLVQEVFLGIEIPPEPYMDPMRRVLFVVYAIVSYVYKWLVTFTLLWFMYNFLRPYKLEVVSSLLTLASIASMAGWPLYRLGKNIYRRGRLPDMKRWRLLATTGLLSALLFFVFMVPIPISRIRASGQVQAFPDDTTKVFVRYPGILEKLNVQDGQKVKPGEILAYFRNRELESKIDQYRSDAEIARSRVKNLMREKESITDLVKRREVEQEISLARGETEKAETEVENLSKVNQTELIIISPRAGIISGAPKRDDVGKTFERDATNAFCTISAVDSKNGLRICVPVVTAEFNQLKQNAEEKTIEAKEASKALEKPIHVQFAQTKLRDVLTQITQKMPEARFVIENDPSQPLSISDVLVNFNSDSGEIRLTEVLDSILSPIGYGFVIINNSKDPNNGVILVRPGGDRGTLEGNQLNEIPVQIRVQGHDKEIWEGKVLPLPESEAREIPIALSNRGGGPVAVKGNPRSQTLVPQTQHYLVYVKILNPDSSITIGSMAQVKIYCKPETVANWVYRKINDLFDIRLM